MKTFPMVALMVLATPGAGAQDPPPDGLRLARIFGDHMVLQQEKPIRVWGWTEPGAVVAVTLTQDPDAATAVGAPAPPAVRGDGYSVTVRYVERNAPMLDTTTATTRSGSDGRFAVQFQPARASFRPTWIVAKSGDATTVVADVLIGEVWVCAGQSNMGWSNFNRKDREVPSSDYPGLRYVAWHDSYYEPLDDLRRPVRWQPCSPETAEGFAAVPYLYGAYLHR